MPGYDAVTNRPTASYPYVDEYDVEPVAEVCCTTRPDCDLTTASDTACPPTDHACDTTRSARSCPT